MGQYTLLLLLLFHKSLTQVSSVKDCVIDYRSLENMWEPKLVQHIQQCAYNPIKPPLQNSPVPETVILQLVLRTINFDIEEQVLSLYTWIFMHWKDERLTWDPEKYGGLNYTELNSGKIWVPGIKLINSVDNEYDRRMLYTPCKVTKAGTVICTSWVVFRAKCDTDLTDWPFDTQTCMLVLGTYPEKGVRIQLDVGPHSIWLLDEELGREWDIVDFQQLIDQNSEKQLILTFGLERHADVLAAIIIFPAFILSLLTLSTLLIDARSNTRLLLICFSLMCHFYFLSELAADIPRHTKNSPRLLWYYRGSFVMTSLMIVVSYVLKLICRIQTACPNWIISCNNFVYMKIVRFVIWPRWETNAKDISVTAEFVKNWTDFANMVNSVWIVVSVIVYVSLYCIFMPHPMFAANREWYRDVLKLKIPGYSSTAPV